MAMAFVDLSPLPASSLLRRTSLSAAPPLPAAAGLCSAFLSPPTSLSFPSSSFSGLSLNVNFNYGPPVEKKRRVFTVRAGKAALCQTKRNRSRKSLARTHGFRRRMRTTSGRALLKRRRAKGRKVLCTKSYPSSGKRA